MEQSYGIDWDGPKPVEHSDGESADGEISTIEIPCTLNPICYENHILLKTTINLLSDSEMHGVDIYLETLYFIEDKVNQIPNN